MPEIHEEKITAYITKYALSQGIQKVEGYVCHETSMHLFRDDNSFVRYYHKGQWHRTPEEALKRAEQMRKTRVAALERKLTKFENLIFRIN